MGSLPEPYRGGSRIPLTSCRLSLKNSPPDTREYFAKQFPKRPARCRTSADKVGYLSSLWRASIHPWRPPSPRHVDHTITGIAIARTGFI